MRSSVRFLRFVIVCLTLALGTLSIANAFPVTWVLNGATFTDGGTATGSFVYDADANTLSNWSVAVAGGDTATFPVITYDTTTSSGFFSTSNPTTVGVELTINSSTREIRMPGTSALSDAGGTIPISTANGVECYNCGPFRPFASGSLVGTAAPAITSANTAAFTVGALGNFTVTSTGAPTPALAESGTLPAGVSFVDNGDGTATLSGTPTAGGSFPITITASNGVSPDATQNFTLTVSAPTIVLSPGSLLAATVGAAYNQTISASGGIAPYTYALTSGAVPAGLTLSSAGVLSGTPTAGGSFTFTVTATDSSTGTGPYTGSQAYTLTVNAPTINLSPVILPAATVAAAYSQAISASGGTSPYTFAVTSGALPAGLTLSSAGVLSGTPTAGGPFTFTVTATDSSTGTGPYTGSRAFTLTVNAPTITLSPAILPAATVGAAFSQTISASGGTSPYTFAVTSGALPAGLTLSSAGVLSGTPTAGGSFTFTATATDSSTGSGPYTGSRAYTLTVNPPTITLSPGTLPATAVAAAYNQTISASGGTSTYTFAVTSGALPAGLTLSSAGVLSGTPTAGGSFNFTVTATDSSTGTGPYTGSQAYTLTVNPPTITLTPTTLPGGTNGVAYPNQTITASGGTATYTYAVTAGALPGGLTLSSGGVLSGTPTAGGTFNFTVTATDSSTGSGPYTGSQAYALVLAAGTQTITITAQNNIYLNLGPATVTATASSGLPVTLTTSTPTICSVSGSGPTFTVTLLAAGTCTLDAAQAGDANFQPATATVNILVLAAIAPTPMLGYPQLLALIALLGLIGFVRSRRA